MKDLNIGLEGELVESSPNSTSRIEIQGSRLGRDSALGQLKVDSNYDLGRGQG